MKNKELDHLYKCLFLNSNITKFQKIVSEMANIFLAEKAILFTNKQNLLVHTAAVELTNSKYICLKQLKSPGLKVQFKLSYAISGSQRFVAKEESLAMCYFYFRFLGNIFLRIAGI